MITRHSEYITHESRLYFITFPDSRCVYWPIHGHATPLSDPETEARSGIMVKCPLRWVRGAHVVGSAA